jgi:hypothetical protein
MVGVVKHRHVRPDFCEHRRRTRLGQARNGLQDHQHCRGSHLLLDIPTEFRLRLLHRHRRHPITLSTHSRSNPVPLDLGELPRSTSVSFFRDLHLHLIENGVAEVPDLGFSLFPESFQFELAVVRQVEVDLELLDWDERTSFWKPGVRGIGHKLRRVAVD